MRPSSSYPTHEALTHYIDRFLYAAGWRITEVTAGDPGGYAVTLTKEGDPGRGSTVTRTASSAGEATFKACSSARALDASL